MPELRGTDPYRPPEARIASDGFERQKVPNKRGFGFLVAVFLAVVNEDDNRSVLAGGS